MQAPLKNTLQPSPKTFLKKVINIGKCQSHKNLLVLATNLTDRVSKGPPKMLFYNDKLDKTESRVSGKESHHNMVALDTQSFNRIPQKFPLSTSFLKDQSIREENSVGRAKIIESSKKMSPKTRAERGTLDLKRLLDETAISKLSLREESNLQQNKSFNKIRFGFDGRDINHLKERGEAAKFINESKGDDLHESQGKFPNDVFRLTLNESFHTGLKQYQPYLNYCNRRELDKQILVSDVKNQLRLSSNKLNKTPAQDGVSSNNKTNNLILSTEKSSNPIEKKPIHLKVRQNYKRGVFRLRGIEDNPSVESQTEKTVFLNHSKIAADHNQSHAHLSPADEKFIGKELSQKFAALDSTFEKRFTKRDPIENNNKQLEFLLALRLRKKIQKELEVNGKFPMVINSLQRKNQQAIEKSHSEKILNLKRVAKLVEKEFHTQSERFEETVKNFASEFKIPA